MILHDIRTPFVAPRDLMDAISYLGSGGTENTRRYQPYLTPTGRVHLRIIESYGARWTANYLRQYAQGWRSWAQHQHGYRPIPEDSPLIDWSRVR